MTTYKILVSYNFLDEILYDQTSPLTEDGYLKDEVYDSVIKRCKDQISFDFEELASLEVIEVKAEKS